ncbi:MAG: peptidylprolyl isomerase, partial [Ruminococcus sp.]|nr:peptidylprolyl isomerase [Ruminococcus sp.]
MKKKNILLKIIIILTIVMGGLTAGLLFIQAKQAENNSYITIDPETLNLIQLDSPKDGDPIAIVDTTLGEFRFILFPHHSPQAVENFIKFANEGYYDGTYVFNSESGAYSAAGSKLKNGEMPENYDVDRELIPRELHQDLWPFRGAVCSMTTTVERSFKEKVFGGGNYYNGSRFAVINSIEFDEEMTTELLENSQNEALGKAFVENGGIPNFSQQLTVIGQTYEGLDVVEKLANLETENNGYYKIPKEDIMINSVVISEYSS